MEKEVNTEHTKVINSKIEVRNLKKKINIVKNDKKNINFKEVNEN